MAVQALAKAESAPVRAEAAPEVSIVMPCLNECDRPARWRCTAATSAG
jgi:hypothetical protein